jgi:hypothetical protein
MSALPRFLPDIRQLEWVDAAFQAADSVKTEYTSAKILKAWG